MQLGCEAFLPEPFKLAGIGMAIFEFIRRYLNLKLHQLGGISSTCSLPPSPNDRNPQKRGTTLREFSSQEGLVLKLIVFPLLSKNLTTEPSIRTDFTVFVAFQTQILHWPIYRQQMSCQSQVCHRNLKSLVKLSGLLPRVNWSFLKHSD